MAAAEQMEFERAAALRDRIIQMQDLIGKRISDVEVEAYTAKRGHSRKKKASQKVPRPKRG